MLGTLQQFGGLDEQQDGEDDEMQPRQRLLQALIVPGKPPEAGPQAKERSTTQRRGSSTKPFLASGSLTTSSTMPAAWAASAGASPV